MLCNLTTPHRFTRAINGLFSGRGQTGMSILIFVETLPKTPVLIANRVRCGKPNCRCACGDQHGPFWSLRWRVGTSQRRRYVRQADVAAVRAVLDARQARDREMRLLSSLAVDELRRVRAWLKTL